MKQFENEAMKEVEKYNHFTKNMKSVADFDI